MARPFKAWAMQNEEDKRKREEEEDGEQTRPKSFKAWKQENTEPATTAPMATTSPVPTEPSSSTQRIGFKAWRQEHSSTPIPTSPQPVSIQPDRLRPGWSTADLFPREEADVPGAIPAESNTGNHRSGRLPESVETPLNIDSTSRWSRLYSDGTITRGQELAAKSKLTDDEKNEARAISKKITSALRPDSIFTPITTNETEFKEYSELVDLNSRLTTKTSWFSGFGSGVAEALGFDWISDRINDLITAITGYESGGIRSQDLTASAKAQYPGWNVAGNIAGSAAELTGVSNVVGGALNGASWFAKLTPWLKRAVSSAITFGITDAAKGVTETQTKEEWDAQQQAQKEIAEQMGATYTPKEYNAWEQLGKVGISAATGIASGALGSALGTAFGKGTSSILIRNGLQYNNALRAIAAGINGVGFAAGSTAAQEISKYLQYPDEYQASPAEIGTNLAVAFLFSTASSAISEIKTAKTNKEALLKMMDELAVKYESAKIKMAGMTGDARIAAAGRALELSKRIRTAIATSTGMSGVQEEVKKLVTALDIIDDQMGAILAGGNGLLGAADIMSEAGAVPGEPLALAIQRIGADVPAPTGAAAPTISASSPESQVIPEWYAAYQNAPRTVDRPVQQRPTLTLPTNPPAPAATPAQAAQQAEIQAPILPAPKPVTKQATAPTDEAPAPPAPVRSEELTPEPERGIVEEKPAETPALPEGTTDADIAEMNGVSKPLWNYTRRSSSPVHGTDFKTKKNYMGDGKAIVEVDSKAESVAMADKRLGGVGARSQDMTNVMEKAKKAAASGSPLTEQPKVWKTTDGERYVFPSGTDGTVLTVGKDAARLIDNGNLLLYIDNGSKIDWLVSVNDDGSIHGVAPVSGVHMRPELYDSLPTGRLKGVNPAAQKATPAETTPDAQPLPLPTAEETLAPEPAKMTLPTVEKEETDNGGNNGGVDSGRQNIRGGKSGPGGLSETGEEPRAGESVSGSGQRGKVRVRDDEGRIGEPGARSGRPDDSVRHEQGDDVGSPGKGNESSVSGVAGEAAGSAEPGRLGGTDESGRSAVTRAKPRNRNNYRITEDIDSKRPNFNDNIAAIKLMKELLESGRKPTAEDQAVLAKYKGWGALKDILLENSYYGRTLKNLLTEEEYNAAKLSVLNAHYTSTKVISAMYDAVKRLGFTGGRVLEPSMGVGNFFGMMPDKLSKASDLYGVELDSITGNIAKLLYPDAKIDVAGFQDVLYPDDTFDLVIGNVPFSNDVKVPYRNKTYNLHDFFFIKALDETRPGGIVALITSTGTLDKMDGKTQKAIADRANLIAAFRLPNDAFKTNAGTEVTTDLIFLQKKGPGIEDNGIEFQKRGKINDIEVNEYYVAHPKNILGTLAQEHVYSKDSWTTVVIGNGENMQEVLTNAFKTLPKNIMNPGENTGLKLPVVAKKRGERSKANFTVNADGSVTITDSKTGEIIEYGNATKAEKDKVQTIKDYIGLKNTFLELLETENNGGDGSALREKLNRQYDDFVKRHKHLSDKANKKLLSPDGDYIRTTGIEVKAKEGYEKSDIFRVPTVSKVRKTHADSAEEALSIVLNENGKVDLKRMAELTGRTEKQLLDDLDEEIIQTPDGDYQLIAQYASGNIYKKLDQIKDRPGFNRQRKILEAALPRRRGAGEIEATIGSHWIAPEYVQDFIRDTFETNATVQFSKELGKWALQMGWTGVRRFSTNSVSTAKIVEATLNGKNVEVYDRMPDGGKVLNETETKLAQAKQEDLREAFRNWAFKDSKRAEALIDSYNRNLNAVAPMNYEALADRLDFGVNPNSRKQPRPYQKAAAARIVFGGNTLLHNGVGTGKTLTMILAARMLKQAGIAQKPMFVVPNGKVEDFRSEILEAYPDAKILAIDDDAMTPKQVQSTKTQIATGDWDFVIIYRTAFQRIPLSPELEAQMLQRQVDMYESAARDMAGERNGKKSFEKGLQARLETLRNRIKKVLDKPHDDTTYFDDMGVDALFVDEAHNYKKVGFPTSFQFSGIVADTNDITTDLYMKEELMRDRGNRIVLATATPITNAISEMYNMAMHVAPEVYQDAGIYSFDTWANTFVNIESQPEIASDGKTYRRKERARNFKNANALFGLYRQFADIKQTKDVVTDLPKAETITIKSKASDLHKQILTYLSGLPVDKTLQMNNDGKNAAVDLRLAIEVLREMGIEMTPEELDLPGSKINRAVEAIIDEYHKSQDVRGTQFVFLDVGVNSEGKRYHFNLYDDLVNKLVKNGIPKEEIAKIGDYDGEDERQVLYEKMNNGEIRVLIGSTAKMGEGVNAQRRAVALHHLSVPYRPDNLEQREGRIVRSGNINKNVRIYRYIQEESYDSYLWQMIERKAAYLAEAYNGGDATEVDELSEAQVNAREAKAIATGNPIIIEKMNLQDKIAKLKILQRGWQGEQHDATRNLEKARAAVIDASNKVKNAETDMETYQREYQKAGEEFAIAIGNKTYDNRKDATDALTPILAKKKAGKIGTVYGFEYGLRYDFSRNEYHLYALGENEYINSMGDSAAGNLTRILNLVEKGPSNMKTASEQRVKLNESAIRDAQQTLKTPFKQKAELEEAQARMKEIDAELGIASDAEAVETGVQESRDTANFNGNTAPRHPENWTATRVGDKNKTPMSGPDIVEMIRHDFDIPISTGNIRSPQARAQYHRLPQSVRSKVANSIPDIAHELGHHLDNIFDIHNRISAEAKKEIVDAMPESFKAQYKKEQLPGEGIAEFLRRYLQNSETAAMDYPKFTEQFMGLLDNKTRAAVDKLADEVNAYYSLSQETGNWPIHNREDKGRDYRNMGEKLKDMNTHFRTLFIDSMEPIKQMDAETGGRAYLFATNAAYAGNRAYAAITGDLYDLRGNRIGEGLQKALKDIHINNKREFSDFGMYLVCRQGPDRLKIGRVFGNDAFDSTAYTQQKEKELAEKYPAFEEAANKLYEFEQNVMDAYGVASGLYDQETIDEWREKFGPYYVPINRWFGERDGNTRGQKQGFANQKRPIGHFIGSGLDIINPVDNIMENTVRLITASIRNEVMQEITKAAEHMEGSGRWMEKVPMPLARKTWDGKGLKAKTLEEFDDYFTQAGKSLGNDGMDLIQRILDGAIDDLLVQYTRGKAHGDIVTVMKNGKPEYWKINDPDLLRSVTNMGPTRAGELLNYYGRVTRFITGNITGMNIVWSIASNLPRDIGTMFTFSKTKNIAKLLAGIGESYVNKLRGDKASELYKEFMAMGGNSTSAQTADKDMAKKARRALQKQKTDWLNPLEWVEFVSDMIESGPRYSYYKICRTKYNMTPEEAFYAAMEITVNFKKAGVLSKEINILVPFFNAGVQGVDRAARWLAAEDIPKEERKAGRTRRIAAYLGASLAIAALSMVLNARTKKKQEDLEKLSNYTKNNYFVIQMKNGKYIAIPKPRELAIPISLFERIMERVVSNNKNAFDDFWEYATDNLLPGVVSGVAQGDLNSAIGDLGFFGTLHYLASNQDFLGRPIVSGALENLEPKDQYNQNTSKLAKLIGQAFNLSPQQIDFLGNNMFGGFWQWQKALAPVSGKTDLSLGVSSKWVKDPLYSTDVTNRMYNHRDALEKKKNSNPGDMEIAAEYRTVRDTATFYGRYYNLAKNEEETERSREVREAMLDLIMGAEENANNDPAHKFLMEVIEREGSTDYMPTVLDTTLKADDKKTVSLNSEEYFMLQTRYNSLYYNYIRQAMDNRPSMSDEEKTATVEAAKKIAGIVARGESIEAHGESYEAYSKVKELLDDGIEEGDLINYLSARDLADADGSGVTSSAELLLAAGGLKLPTVDTAKLISYNEPGLGLKLKTVGDYGVDATEYGKVLEALGDDNVTQANVQAAIDAVYGRTTNSNRQEKAAMWQAMNKGWNPKNNPYSQNTGRNVQNALKLPTADDTPERPSSGLKLPTAAGDTGKDRAIVNTGWLKHPVPKSISGETEEETNILMELWDMEGHGGNVNLRNRKAIPITGDNADIVRGWGMDADGGYMTVASQTYRDGKTAIVVTPILRNGDLMTQQELDAYMDDLMARGGNYADNDDKGIILGVFGDGSTWSKNLEDSDDFANRVHELHEELEEIRGKRKPTKGGTTRNLSGLKLPTK